MCRWLAYYGKPIRMDTVLYQGQYSLIDQSLKSRLGAEPTNGDGFGIGWYSVAGEPGVFKSTEPAWNDRNLREISGHVESHLFLAHIRATTGTPVQQTNGERLWAFRYSSEGRSRSLYFSTAYDTLKALYPDDPRLDDFDEETRVVVSEPLGDVAGVWNQVPEASWGVVQPGQDEMDVFRPAAPVEA